VNSLSVREKGIFARSARALEFDDVRERVASFCKTETGADICRSLKPAKTRNEAETLLDETGELREIFNSGINIFPSPVENPASLLKKTSRGLLPEPDDIQKIISFWRQLKLLNGFHSDPALKNGVIMKIIGELNPLEETAGFFDATFGDDGKVKPTASAALIEIEERINSLKKHIREKADSFLKKQEIVDILQDTYVTIRNDRIVLPIKAEYKNIFPGIIHGISASDKTAFMEPQELIRENNSLQEALSEREVEIYRLLRLAAQQLKDNHDEIERNYLVMGRIDAISAKAQFSIRIKGKRPLFSDDGSIILREITHPMMVFRGENPRANSVEMAKNEMALVISGPNAGGKTVLLKSAGLSVVFASCGIFPSCGEGTTFPFTKNLFAMVGDEQSVEEGESTFSAQLNGIKEAALGVQRGDWIIIDEILNGTDPRQASALALSVLEHFIGIGCKVFVSTHLPDLKIAAQESAEMVNGAMGFSQEGKPTYKLEKGHPGVSYPLAVAASIGLPPEIIERAKSMLDSTQDIYQSALQALQEKADKLDRTIEEYERSRAESERIEKELAANLEESNRNARAFEDEKRRLLKDEVRKAKTKLSAMIDEAEEAELKDKRKTSSKLKEMENVIVRESRTPESIPLEDVPAGGNVWIIPLDRRAQLVKKAEGGKVEVQSGGIKMTLAASDVVGLKEGALPPEKKKRETKIHVDESEEYLPYELLLLGLTFEESLTQMEQFFDKHLLAGSETVRIVHGRGPLKGKIEEYLKSSSYVRSFSPAAPAQGGEGATIITLG